MSVFAQLGEANMGYPMRLVPALNCIIIFAHMLLNAPLLNAQRASEGICGRTKQVRDEILAQIDGVSDCGLVTSTHLSSVTTLSLNNSGITALQSDDLSGFSSLEILRLKDNSLSTLPAGVFSGLTSLT
ncbi:MAG: leucine-rich repeat domain-containing protein, partial [Gemmatimonadetes bacterium]|nr:leucine-rich repeat domain-containing protein [Gemmatimonadota bacterium]